jgi:hypothetical protein
MSPQIQPALQLRDIHLPAMPSVWPPAPGWWMLAALLLALLAWVGIVALRRHRIRQARQRILDEIARLEAQLVPGNTTTVLSGLSVLLRRHALLRYPHDNVAGLTGVAWLRFLDVSSASTGFSEGPGRVLVTGPYQRDLPQDFDATGLLILVRQWVDRNSGRPQARPARQTLRATEITP